MHHCHCDWCRHSWFDWTLVCISNGLFDLLPEFLTSWKRCHRFYSRMLFRRMTALKQEITVTVSSDAHLQSEKYWGVWYFYTHLNIYCQLCLLNRLWSFLSKSWFYILLRLCLSDKFIGLEAVIKLRALRMSRNRRRIDYCNFVAWHQATCHTCNDYL